jgi:hypothetical protein
MDASFVDQRKFLLSSWPHLFSEIFALNMQHFPFFIHCLYKYFYQTELDINEVFNYLTYRLKQDVLHSFDLVLFLNGVTIVLSCSCIPSLGCPIHIKSSRIYFIRFSAISFVIILGQHTCSNGVHSVLYCSKS